MKELILIILVLDILAEIFLIRRLEKERDDAEDRAGTHFKRADKFEKQLKETKKEYEEQAEILLENSAELRNTINGIIEIIESEHFSHDKVEKIKELVDLPKSN